MTETTSLVESRSRQAGWAMALRGVVAVIFGLIALRYPSAAAGAFVIIFAVFAFADAILEFVVARTAGRIGARWGWYVVGGIVSLVAGVVALVYPTATFFALVLLVGARALATGIVEIGAALTWRELDSKWLLGLTGALSIVLAVLLFASPVRGGVALLWTIGVYAIVLGVMMLGAGVTTATRHRHRASSEHAAAA